MKKKVLALFLVLALCMPFMAACGGDDPDPAPAPAQNDTPAQNASAQNNDNDDDGEYYSQDFEVTNSTGVDIWKMYISPSEENVWGPDVLGDEIFSDGETRAISFDIIAVDDYAWDLMIEDEEGTQIVFRDLYLSTITWMELLIESGQAIALHDDTSGGSGGGQQEEEEEEYYSQDFEIYNGTEVDIYKMFISPTNETTWGPDVLGNEIFSEEETRIVTFDIVGTADLSWDLRIEDAAGNSVSFTGLYLSQISSIELYIEGGAGYAVTA